MKSLTHTRKSPLSLLAYTCILSIVYLFILATDARAAALTEAVIRVDRMAESQTDVDMLVLLKPATAIVEDEVRITFDSSWTVDATNTNIITTVTGVPTTFQGESVTTLPGIGGTASGVSGQAVDISATDLTVGTLYGFKITAGIDSPTAEQSKHTIDTLISNVSQDTAEVATRTLSAGGDQITINATVPPTFTMNFEASSDTFTADLDADAVISTTGLTITFGTNASKGWGAWLSSANAGLTSVTASQTIVEDGGGTVDGTPTTIDPNDTEEYYQLDVTNPVEGTNGTSNAPTIAAEYDGDATSGGTFSTSLQEIAYGDGTTDSDTIDLYARAVPSAIRAAATDYADTWTVVGAANF